MNVSVDLIFDVILGVATTKEELQRVLFDLDHQDTTANQPESVTDPDKIGKLAKSALWSNLVSFGLGNYTLLEDTDFDSIDFEELATKEGMVEMIVSKLKEKIANKLEEASLYNPQDSHVGTGKDARFQNIGAWVSKVRDFLKVSATSINYTFVEVFLHRRDDFQHVFLKFPYFENLKIFTV